MRRLAVLALALVLALLAPRVARAHKPSDAYLTLSPSGASTVVRWDLAVRDLDFALALDADRDGKVTFAELRAAEGRILEAASRGLALSTPAGACPLGRASLAGVASHSDGQYAVLFFEAPCGLPGMSVKYRFLFDVDPSHRAIVRVTGAGEESVVVLSKAAPDKALGAASSRSFAAIVKEGVVHIWTGYDHMLFLLALLLPAVLAREEGRWSPRDRFGEVAWDVARVVTAFTAAHSITLSLAALGLVSLPSRFVESSIAASVVVAAANNVRPFLRQDRWLAAFVLGLMHGFGFSSTLADVGLARGTLLSTLVGFNAGVEVGQLAVVAVFLPAAFAARRTGVYRGAVLRGGSIVIALVGLLWLVERAFDVRLLSRLG